MNSARQILKRRQKCNRPKKKNKKGISMCTKTIKTSRTKNNSKKID